MKKSTQIYEVDRLESCQEKIQTASKLLHNKLYKLIIDSKIDLLDCVLKLTFSNGLILYITYNNHREYSYHLIYTKNELDRERFDNYDKNWDVKTKPHHFHTKGQTTVDQSPMTGDLENDVPKLMKFLFERLN